MGWLLPFAAGLLIGAVLEPVLDWWRRGTRGEFHCDQCGSVTPLPKDEP
jgi:hypothetical protein